MNKTVAEVMTPDPIVVRPDTPIQEAIQLLADKNIGALPVLDESGKLVGVLSESDLMWRESGVETPPYFMFLDSIIYLKNPARYEKEVHKALGPIVGEVMNEKPIVITPDRLLRDAAYALHHKNVHQLVVVDRTEKVVGILSQGDIIRAMAEVEAKALV